MREALQADFLPVDGLYTGVSHSIFQVKLDKDPKTAMFFNPGTSTTLFDE
jgi:hypothetical protein